jgi:hypothetical protein
MTLSLSIYYANPMPPKISAAASDSPGSDPDAEPIDLEQSLSEAEQSLLLLKARYTQVQTDQDRQQTLKIQLNQAQQQLKQPRSHAIRTELRREIRQLKTQLEAIELALESQLFSWKGLKDVFWQAVRFGGLGVIVGWLLRSWAG